MGLFTALDDADLASIAAAFALGPVTTWRALAAGTINSNFLVDTAAGRWFVRVNEGKDEADVAWESDLVAALAAAGVPTPAPVVDRAGRGYIDHRGLLVSCFPWRPGRHHRPDEVSPADTVAVGTALARLHLAAAPRAATQGRRSIYDHAHIKQRFAGFRDRPDAALAPAIAILSDELAWLDAHAAARAAASHGIIHGDLFRDNVLFDGDELVAVLDFEQASTGSLVYDLAVCLNDWAWDGDLRVDVARGLIDGYQAVRPLSAADRQALPIEVRAAAARFTITRITDVFLPGIDNPDKDFRAYLGRVEGWRAGRLGGLGDAV